MAHILIVSTGRTSLRNRCVELMRRLEDAGHTCTFAGPEALADTLERNGVRFEPLDLMPGDPPSEPASGPGGPVGKAMRWVNRVRNARTRRAEAASRLVDSRYPALLERLAPDLVLVDVELQPYVIVSYGVAPTAVLCPFIAPQKVGGVPPLHMAIRPGRGFRGTAVGIELAWLRYRTWKSWKHLLPRIAAPGSDRIAVLRELADRAGFPHRRLFALYDWLLPMSFRGLPILNLNALEFDFPHTPHPDQRHTGPLIRLDRDDNAEPGTGGPGDEVRRFLGERDRGRKLVYCAFGTAFAGDDSTFLAKVIGAVRDRDDWDVVVSLGGRSPATPPAETPEHVKLFGWVPQLEVLEQADCAVLHAGPGSIYECVHYGVPMVLFPFNVNDQLGYGERAAYHGLGKLGDREGDSPASIAAHIEEVLSDGSYAEAVQRLQMRCARYNEDGTAVRRVEELLRNG